MFCRIPSLFYGGKGKVERRETLVSGVENHPFLSRILWT
jgi:hypothetical protein